jgi:isoleucyl-tRNA synthetase
MAAGVIENLDRNDPQKAVGCFTAFIDLLNNWYIRRSRRRFWRSAEEGGSEGARDKASGYATLERVLKRLVLVLAPTAPFVSDEIWRNLRRPGDAESVHLAEWPTVDSSLRDVELERKMGWARRAVSMGRALRVQHDLKTRQPLRAVHLVTKDKAERAVLEEKAELLKEELNVKEVVFRDDEEELVDYCAKANFRTLGKELGKDMKAAAACIEELEGSQVADILSGKSVYIEVAGKRVELTTDKVEVKRNERAGLKVLNEGSLTVALDAELDRALLEEGWVRDLVRGVQNLRKEAGFEVTDRIILSVAGDDGLKAALDSFATFVREETLAATLSWAAGPAIPGSGGAMSDIEAGSKVWRASVAKA